MKENFMHSFFITENEFVIKLHIARKSRTWFLSKYIQFVSQTGDNKHEIYMYFRRHYSIHN